MDKEEALANESVPKLFFSLAIPAVFSQCINLLYNVVDRIFVGHIADTGALAFTALGVCVPIIMLISSLAQFVSSGAAPLSSILLGRGEKQKAEWVLGNAVTAILLMTVFITVVLLCFAREILFFVWS